MGVSVAAIAVVVFMAMAPSIIDRFPQRDHIGVYVLIPLLFLFVGAVFWLARW